MNIIISGWPATGASTAAKFVALVLNMKYMTGGGMLKFWAAKMGYDPKTNALNEWINLYGKDWDKFWDSYAEWKISKETNLLIDTKILGFLVKKNSNLKKIFITASTEARLRRSSGDKRLEAITQRDEILKHDWMQAYGVNIFDLDQIRKNYNFVLDTSSLGIAEVPAKILEYLDGNDGKLLDAHLTDLQNHIEQYHEDNEYVKKMLIEHNLLISPEEIIEEWQNTLFRVNLKNLPDDMIDAIL